MANVGSKGILRHIDDPSVTVIAAATAGGVTWVSDADTSDTDFVKAVAAGKGLHYAGALHATDNNMIEFCGNNLQFCGQEGHAAVEVLVQFDDVSDLAFNFGFNDEVEDSGNTLPIELATATFTSNASAFVGFVYDDDATNTDLHAFWVNGDSDTETAIADLRFTGMGLTAAKWLYLKVEIQDRGSGNGVRATLLAVDHNGRSMEKVFNTTVSRATPLCWHFTAENRAATAHNIYLRHCNWEQTVADM